MTKINLSSSQFSSLPSLHSRIPSQGIAMIVMSIVPGRRFSIHSMVASFGKVSLQRSNSSSSPYRQWKLPTHVFSERISLFHKVEVVVYYVITHAKYFTFWYASFAFYTEEMLFFTIAFTTFIFIWTNFWVVSFRTVKLSTVTKGRKCVRFICFCIIQFLWNTSPSFCFPKTKIIT